MTITNGYVSSEELKAFVGIYDAIDDATAEAVVSTVSRSIDDFTRRRFYADETASARIYRAHDATRLEIDDISSTSGLIVKTDDDDDGVYETTWALDADFQLEPLNAPSKNLPYNELIVVGSKLFPTNEQRTYMLRARALRARVQVTAKWGWASVPDPVVYACRLQCSRLFNRKNAPFGIADLASLNGGGMQLRDRLDPDVELLLRPYRRYAVLVG